MMGQRQWCRVLLGLSFAAGAFGALFLLVWVMPTLDRDSTVILTRRVLPFWLTLAAALYASLALVALASSRVHRATEKGFDVMEVPDAPYD
jgi:hypothetical protein